MEEAVKITEGTPAADAAAERPGASGGGEAAGGSALLLESCDNTVTGIGNEHGALFEVAKCRCNCWFCPDCCMVKGYALRDRLIPVLATFRGLMMVTLTIDPSLFPDPKSAFLYVMRRRCIGRTLQDLRRGGYLHSGRYFYVVEWQAKTEQAHFHVLLDASFIPFSVLLASWSKHRPPGAGPVVGNRPAFGTVLFSKRRFEGGARHAASYATKYLVKTPEAGYPAWVLAMGKDRRVRRYSVSRGFWGGRSARKRPVGLAEEGKRRNGQTYSMRLGKCGQTVNVFEVEESLDTATGEVDSRRKWVGRVGVPARDVLPNIFDPGEPERPRRSLLARGREQVLPILSAAAGRSVYWLRPGEGDGE